MVKKIDESLESPSDHVGVALWRAARRWRTLFAEEMASRGYPWHREARGEVMAYLGPSGRSQAQLVAEMGISKQAVQQLLDQLEADKVIRRVNDPRDKRAKRIELTALGLEDYRERGIVKARLEEEYRRKLGDAAFEDLMRSLDKLERD